MSEHKRGDEGGRELGTKERDGGRELRVEGKELGVDGMEGGREVGRRQERSWDESGRVFETD